MRILHIIPSVDTTQGGPIEGVNRMGEVLAGLGITQELLTLDPMGSPLAIEHKRTVHALGEPAPPGAGLIDRFRRWAHYSPVARDWAKLRVHDYDAVVVNSLWNYATRIARLSLVGSGIPYVVYPHGMLDPWFRRRYPIKHAAKQLLWWFNEGVLLRNADAVLFTCDEERRLARQTFFPYQVNERVVAYGAGAPPSADPEHEKAFRAMLPALGARRYLLFMSRIHEKKGCDLLIDAFATIAAKDSELDLVIAGPDQAGWCAALRAQAKSLGIADRIHWPGMLLAPVKYGALRGSEAFILPSHQENFGIVVAEALACGCVVLISDQVNIWREIAAAEAGLVKPDTLAGTTALLARFAALDTSQKAAMRKRAVILFAEQFDVRQAGLALAETLHDITQKKKLLSYK